MYLFIDWLVINVKYGSMSAISWLQQITTGCFDLLVLDVNFNRF
jgi:hypothetical protein